MTQQKSEDCVVPEGLRKQARTRGVEPPGGGKAVPVKEMGGQLSLSFATAESPGRSLPGAEGREVVDLSTSRIRKAPKAEDKLGSVGPASLERVVEHLELAFKKVAANRGAPGPDRQTIQEVRRNLPVVLAKLRTSLLDGTYLPGDIRRKWIPKAGGEQRGLGIPNVVDRVVQEALRAVLEPLYEPTFHPSSHGFRPNRSCHTAIAEACGYVGEGYDWVVDVDLKQFFDQVPHQRLLARLAQRVRDQRLLTLIQRMLVAKVVLPDGVRVATEEGVPQGGPLSPLLSNIVLSELDEELAQRGHRFVRYADDCNVYVRSERAGQRVMASLTLFIERRLRLQVNASKSAVARPETRHFLGYRLRPKTDGGPVEILLSERSETRLREKIRELTPRSLGWSLKAIIQRVNRFLTGWMGHFGVCTEGVERVVGNADAHLRRRLRAIQLKQWKTKRTRARRLIRLGLKPQTAWRSVYEGRKSIWHLSHSPGNNAMRNAYFAERGLVPLKSRFQSLWASRLAPRQLLLWDTARS